MEDTIDKLSQRTSEVERRFALLAKEIKEYNAQRTSHFVTTRPVPRTPQLKLVK